MSDSEMYELVMQAILNMPLFLITSGLMFYICGSLIPGPDGLTYHDDGWYWYIVAGMIWRAGVWVYQRRSRYH